MSALRLIVPMALSASLLGCPESSDQPPLQQFSPAAVDACVGQTTTVRVSGLDGQGPATPAVPSFATVLTEGDPSSGSASIDSESGGQFQVTCNSPGEGTIEFDGTTVMRGDNQLNIVCEECGNCTELDECASDEDCPDGVSCSNACACEAESACSDASDCQSDADCGVGEVCYECGCVPEDAHNDLPTAVAGGEIIPKEWVPIGQTCTDLSDDSECTEPTPPFGISEVFDPFVSLNEAAATRIFENEFACNTLYEDRAIFCGADRVETAGDYVFLAARYLGPIPLDGENALTIAFVFETNGNPDDDWQPAPAYPKDFFAGADRWYQLQYDPISLWRLEVQRVANGSPSRVNSGARIILMGDQAGILVPAEELGTAPTFRTSIFAHDGGFGLDGGFWSGDYFPTLEDGLMEVEGASGGYLINE